MRAQEAEAEAEESAQVRAVKASASAALLDSEGAVVQIGAELAQVLHAHPPVAFEKNKSEVLEEGLASLAAVVEVWQTHHFAHVAVEVECGKKGGKNTPFLQRLSEQRASAVRQALIERGLAKDHVVVTGVGAQGNGSFVKIHVSHIDHGKAVQASGKASQMQDLRSQIAIKKAALEKRQSAMAKMKVVARMGTKTSLGPKPP